MAVTITRTALTDDDGTGTTGTVLNNAFKTQLYDQIDVALATLNTAIGAVGAWTTVTFAAGNFTAQAGTWTVTAGQQTTYAYAVLGKTMVLAFCINGGTVSATPTYLAMAIPGGYSTVGDIRCTYYYSANAAATWQVGQAVVAATTVNLYRDPAPTLWAAAVVYVQGQITFRVA